MHGFSLSASKLIHNYLSCRKQRTKNNTSSWKEIFFVVPQDYILDPLLFIIFVCGLFSILSTLSVKNPSVKSDEFLPWWRIFFTDEICCWRNFLPTVFFLPTNNFYRRIGIFIWTVFCILLLKDTLGLSTDHIFA